MGIKLDGKNFPVWSKLMRVAVGSQEKLDHIEGDKAPPETNDPKFQQWQASDFTVFSWLINNMEPRLVLQFAQHQIAKAPPGFEEDFEDGEVCQFKKTLYGLKQSPRAWFGRFTEAVKKYDYQQSNANHTLFMKKKRGKLTCLIIYVDDMIITGDDSEK
ncbi:uncharacterized protein LOC121767027 [Salvia splendens]|uniref:uncharacterized protein LOC121767027 n=1 Tax=Salvia splendens TaxID=180675 RepID=UPI001C25FD3B|nr:uncharacterized protein LOC121767027 [Salvia splendens]